MIADIKLDGRIKMSYDPPESYDEQYEADRREERYEAEQRLREHNAKVKAKLARDVLAQFPIEKLDKGRSYSFETGFIHSMNQCIRYKSLPTERQLPHVLNILKKYKQHLNEYVIQELGFDVKEELTADGRICLAIQEINTVDPKQKLWFEGFKSSLKGKNHLSQRQREICIKFISDYRRQIAKEYISDFVSLLPPPDPFLESISQDYIDFLVEVCNFVLVAKLTKDKEIKNFALSKGLDENSVDLKELASELHRIAKSEELLKHTTKFLESPVLYDASIQNRAIAIIKEFEESNTEISLEEAKLKAKNEIIESFKIKSYPKDVKDAALLAMQILAKVCDYAHAKDFQGFNAAHTVAGHELAKRDELHDVQIPFALFCVKFYKRQLPIEILRTCGLAREDIDVVEKSRKKKPSKKDLGEELIDLQHKAFMSRSFGKYLFFCTKK